MSKKLIGACLISFVAGLGAGLFASYAVLKKKMDEEKEAEIADIKKGYEKLFEHEKSVKPEKIEEDIFEEPTEEEKIEYSNIIRENGYTNYSQVSTPPKKVVKEEDPEHPYTISPSNYGEFEEYNQTELVYYSDMILVDDTGVVVDDISSLIGDDALDRFGEYEEDSVYIRNDRIKTDFAIIRDERTWEEVCGY